MKKLQDKLVIFGDYSCLAQCYIYTVLDYMKLNHDYRETTLLTTLLQCYNNNIGLDDECYVTSAGELIDAVFKTVFCKDVDVVVEKADITSFKDLPFGKYAAVKFAYNGHEHWVLSKDQVQIFNSLENSNCVRLGKPVAARIITIKEKQ